MANLDELKIMHGGFLIGLWLMTSVDEKTNTGRTINSIELKRSKAVSFETALLLNY